MNRTKPLLKIPYFQHYFPDEQSCREFILRMLWSTKIFCRNCNGDFFVKSFQNPLQCPTCKKLSSLTEGTIFQSTRLSLHTIFAMIWLLTCSKKCMNTGEIMKVLQLKSYRITWQWIQKIRNELNFFPKAGRAGEVEADSFTFRVKSKTQEGTIESKDIEILIIMNRKPTFFRLLKMVVITRKTKPEINQLIRDTLHRLIYVPDRTWFYSDERGYYRVRIGKKSKVYQPHCRLALPNMVAREWINWVKSHYRNNIHEEHLQGYLNTFVFHFNQPGKAELPEYFQWIIENIWKQKSMES